MPRKLPLKLTKRRADGLRACRAAADLLLSTGDCSDETARDLEHGIAWIDQLLMLRGPDAAKPRRSPVRVLVIKGGR